MPLSGRFVRNTAWMELQTKSHLFMSDQIKCVLKSRRFVLATSPTLKCSGTNDTIRSLTRTTVKEVDWKRSNVVTSKITRNKRRGTSELHRIKLDSTQSQCNLTMGLFRGILWKSLISALLHFQWHPKFELWYCRVGEKCCVTTSKFIRRW